MANTQGSAYTDAGGNAVPPTGPGNGVNTNITAGKTAGSKYTAGVPKLDTEASEKSGSSYCSGTKYTEGGYGLPPVDNQVNNGENEAHPSYPNEG